MATKKGKGIFFFRAALWGISFLSAVLFFSIAILRSTVSFYAESSIIYDPERVYSPNLASYLTERQFIYELMDDCSKNGVTHGNGEPLSEEEITRYTYYSIAIGSGSFGLGAHSEEKAIVVPLARRYAITAERYLNIRFGAGGTIVFDSESFERKYDSGPAENPYIFQNLVLAFGTTAAISVLTFAVYVSSRGRFEK